MKTPDTEDGFTAENWKGLWINTAEVAKDKHQWTEMVHCRQPRFE